MTPYAGLLRILGRSDADVHGAWRTGSRVYGTANASSDADFLVVLAEETRPDLLFRPRVNIVIQGLAWYENALAEHSIFALEAYFLPTPLKAGAAKWKLDKAKLAASAEEKSASDFAKAKTLLDADRYAAKKKLFHALRVPLFARQIARTGRITDYAEANPLWTELLANNGDWTVLRRYGALRDRICADIH